MQKKPPFVTNVAKSVLSSNATARQRNSSKQIPKLKTQNLHPFPTLPSEQLTQLIGDPILRTALLFG